MEIDLNQAACTNSDPNLWFAEPDRNVNSQDERYERQHAIRSSVLALSICQTCPILEACLRYALDNHDATSYGIWGGLTAYERRKLKGKGYTGLATTYELAIRKAANKSNIPLPTLSPNERAKLLRQQTAPLS